MNNFTDNLLSPFWWLSVVLVGILINLVSAYLKTKLDDRLSKASSWWKERSRARRAKKEAEIDFLRDNPQEQAFMGIMQVYRLVLSLRMLILSLGSIGIFLIFLLSPNSRAFMSGIIGRVALIGLVVTGFIMWFIGFTDYLNAMSHYQNLIESRKANQSNDNEQSLPNNGMHPTAN